MEKAALLSSQEHKAEQSVLQAQKGLMLLLITQCYSLSGGWGREGQAPSVTKETLQHPVSNIWEMLAQVSGGPLCQPMAMSSVRASLGAPCAAKEQGPSKAVEAECWLSLLRKFVAVLLRFRKGHVGCSQSVCGASLDWGFDCCKDEAVGFFCAFSVFLSWSSTSARLNVWVPFHDSPHSFSYALGREEEPVIMSKLAMLCSSNCFMVCLSWWLQEWKISLWDDVEDLCLHALSLGSSLPYVLRHPWLQSGWRKWGFSEGWVQNKWFAHSSSSCESLGVHCMTYLDTAYELLWSQQWKVAEKPD